MNPSSRDRESLPADYDASLRRVDELLDTLVEREPVPTGLVDRVFRVSVSVLRPRLRLVATAGDVSSARILAGRFAMAACLAAAVLTAWWLLKSPSPSPPGAHERVAGAVYPTDLEIVAAATEDGFFNLARFVDLAVNELLAGDGLDQLAPVGGDA